MGSLRQEIADHRPVILAVRLIVAPSLGAARASGL